MVETHVRLVGRGGGGGNPVCQSGNLQYKRFLSSCNVQVAISDGGGRVINIERSQTSIQDIIL